MLINLLNEYFVNSLSSDNNMSRLVNMYLDIADQDETQAKVLNPKYQIIAYPTEGFTLWKASGGTQVRGGINHLNIAYFVIDNHFYSSTSTGVLTSLGTLLTSTGRCKVSQTSFQILIDDGANGYLYDTNALTFAQITSSASFISNLALVTDGQNYSPTPIITITDPTGTGATATATVTSGQITAVTLTSNGNNDYTAPIVTVTDGAGTGATITFTVGSFLQGFSLTSPGSGYTSAPTVTLTNAGTNAAMSATIAGGQVTNLVITNAGQGNGISSTATIGFSGGGGSGAAAIPIIGGSITSAVIGNQGSGYGANATCTIVDSTGYGYGAAIQLGTSAGKVVSAGITAGGTNYLTPIGTISDGTGTGATIDAYVTQTQWPGPTISSTGFDSFFLAAPTGQQTVFACNPSEGSLWNPLSFASKSFTDDNVQCVIPLNGKLVIIGTYNSEMWYNSGAPTFPFEIVSGSNFEYGTPAPNSPAKATDLLTYLHRTMMEQAVYMLAQHKNGGYSIVIITESGSREIHNAAVIEQINSMTVVNDAIGIVHQMGDHPFYTLTFPTENKSFSYDIRSKTWIERQSYVASAYGHWAVAGSVFCYGKYLVWDYTTGNIYYLTKNNYTENNTPIYREITSAPGYNSGNKIYMDKLQIDVQTNVGATVPVTLDVSKDSGQTFPLTYTNNLPQAGGRLYWRRLGMTQNAFVVKLSTTANANFTVFEAQADIRQGIH